MGKAIILLDVDWSNNNLGQVTLAQDIPLESITIIGSAILEGESGSYTIEYNPSNTSEKGVIWTITSGSEYATIDNSGNVTILPGASQNMVTIEAISIIRPEISGARQITVTYVEPLSPELEAFVTRITEDGGTLIIPRGSIQTAVNTHTALLKGSTPKLDFLAYKEEGGVITKLYSLDSTFDIDASISPASLGSIYISGGKICTNSKTRIIFPGYAGNLEKIYYKGGPVDVASGSDINLIGCLPQWSPRKEKKSAIFFQGNKLNFQYRDYNSSMGWNVPLTTFSDFYVQYDGDGDASVVEIDGTPATLASGMADYWGRSFDQSTFYVYTTFELILGA